MFSFARSVMDFIQSATGLKVQPRNLYDESAMEEAPGENTNDRLKKEHSSVLRVCHTPLSSVLHAYKQSLATVQTLDSSLVSLELIEADFVYALSRYCAKITLRGGIDVLIRPILPNDIEAMKLLLQRGEVSTHSLSMRFNSVTTTVKDSMLKYFTDIDYDTHFAIAALIREEEEDGIHWKPVASARFIEDVDDPTIAEWAALVVDKYHGMGVGSSLLYYLSVMSSQFGIQRLRAIVHHENYPVLHWMKKLAAYQEFQCDNRYWIFQTPIYPEWVSREDNRHFIEQAARGSTGELNDECLEELRRTVRGLNHPHYLLERKLSEKFYYGKGGKSEIQRKKEPPTVFFVSSLEDEFDIGDLF